MKKLLFVFIVLFVGALAHSQTLSVGYFEDSWLMDTSKSMTIKEVGLDSNFNKIYEHYAMIEVLVFKDGLVGMNMRA
jgi:hypothetical protein